MTESNILRADVFDPSVIEEEMWNDILAIFKRSSICLKSHKKTFKIIILPLKLIKIL